MNSILSVSNLTRHYPGFTLDHVSFSIPTGSIVGLIGENGAGKSTVIHSILDLIRKDEGSVTFLGQPLTGNNREQKEKIGVVFDEICFYETLTPQKIGKICSDAYYNWDTSIYQSFLERFALPPDKEVKTFSKGMKMKLSIAAALSHHPSLLILDEATSGLDPVVRDDILDVFLDFIQDESHSILLSSHISSDLEKIADYIAFLHEGKLKFFLPKDELLYQYGIIRCSDDVFQKIPEQEILAFRRNGYQWEVLTADKAAARHRYRGNTIVDDICIDDLLLLYVKGEHLK